MSVYKHLPFAKLIRHLKHEEARISALKTMVFIFQSWQPALVTGATPAECTGRAGVQYFRWCTWDSILVLWNGEVYTITQSACLHLFLRSIPHNNFGRHHPVSKKLCESDWTLNTMNGKEPQRQYSYQSNEEKQMKGGVIKINFIMFPKYSNIAAMSTVEKPIQA